MASVVSNIKAISKPIVAALGFILAAVNDHIDVVPVQYRGYVTTAIAILTLVGVYHAPYSPLGAERRSALKSAGKKRHPSVATPPVGPASVKPPPKHEAP